jgi:hypothetical protein
MKLRVPLPLRHGDGDGDGDDDDDDDDDDGWSIGAIPPSLEPVKPPSVMVYFSGGADSSAFLSFLALNSVLILTTCPTHPVHTAHPHAVHPESIRSTVLTTHPPKSFSLVPCAC